MKLLEHFKAGVGDESYKAGTSAYRAARDHQIAGPHLRRFEKKAVSYVKRKTRKPRKFFKRHKNVVRAMEVAALAGAGFGAIGLEGLTALSSAAYTGLDGILAGNGIAAGYYQDANILQAGIGLKKDGNAYLWGKRVVENVGPNLSPFV